MKANRKLAITLVAGVAAGAWDHLPWRRSAPDVSKQLPRRDPPAQDLTSRAPTLVELPLEPVAARQIATERYGILSGSLPKGWQAHHLNENAAFGDIIPRDQGISMGVAGNALTDVGSQHYAIHRSLEGFWDQYRPEGRLFGQRPTNAEYGQAVRQSLVDGGFSPEEASDLAAQAATQRVLSGLSEMDPVPHIPRKTIQRKL